LFKESLFLLNQPLFFSQKKKASFYQLGHTANIFVKLTGYRKKALKEAYEKGWPLIRHLVLYYPYDKTVQEHSNHQFMLGSSLLVAPSLLSTAASVRVYFPKDAHKITWRHIWTGKYYPADGTHSIISAPIGQPAVFVKEPRDDDGLLNDLLDYATTYFQSKN
jgi:alpha-glucosidase (family GH31 glycosyl hydrolase)